MEHNSARIENSRCINKECVSSILHINRDMLPCKLIYFLPSLAEKSQHSFEKLFLLSKGVTIDQIGYSKSIVEIFNLVSISLWGAIIDSLNKGHKIFITSLVLIHTLATFSLPWVIDIVSDVAANSTGNVTLYGNKHGKKHPPEIKLLNPSTVLIAITVVHIISHFSKTGQGIYRDLAVTKVIYTKDEPCTTIGEQKVIAPLGTALGGLIAGLAVDHFVVKGQSPYMITYYTYIPLSLLALPIFYLIIKQGDWSFGGTRDLSYRKKALVISKDIGGIIRSPDNVVFLLSLFVHAYCRETFHQFNNIYMHKTIKSSKTWMSVCNATEMIFEMMAYKLSTKLIKLVGGRRRCLSLVLFVGAGKLVLLSFCNTSVHVFLLQPLSGMERGLAFSAMIEEIWMMFPKTATTSGIILYHILQGFAPKTISSSVDGFIYHKYGAMCLFRGVAVVVALWSVFVTIVFEISKRRRERNAGVGATNTGVEHEDGFQELDEGL